MFIVVRIHAGEPPTPIENRLQAIGDSTVNLGSNPIRSLLLELRLESMAGSQSSGSESSLPVSSQKTRFSSQIRGSRRIDCVAVPIASRFPPRRPQKFHPVFKQPPSRASIRGVSRRAQLGDAPHGQAEADGAWDFEAVAAV